MSRNTRFAFTVLAMIAMISAALGGVLRAGAGPAPVVAPVVRQSMAPLRTMAPLATPTPKAALTTPAILRGARTTWTVWRNAPKLTNVPKISQFLVKVGPHTWRPRHDMLMTASLGGHHLRPYAANGNTIVLTGDANNFYSNDITLTYGSDVYLSCEGMLANQTNKYKYYVYPPNGSAPAISGTFSTNANGTCQGYGNFNLSTPFQTTGCGAYGNGQSVGNGCAGNAAYPGVWVVGLYDGTKFVTETAIVADAALNFTTYANL